MSHPNPGPGGRRDVGGILSPPGPPAVQRRGEEQRDERADQRPRDHAAEEDAPLHRGRAGR